MTLHKKILNCLKDADIKVYPPGVKKGICTFPYVVLEQAQAVAEKPHKSDKIIFNITALAPVGSYSDFLTLIENVRDAMSYLHPEIKFSLIDNEFIDKNFIAYSTAIKFFALKRTNV